MATLILCEDGRHVTLGRHTTPQSHDVTRAAAGLTAQGLSGWVVESAGDYYGYGKMALTERQIIGAPSVDFRTAETRFQRGRNSHMGE